MDDGRELSGIDRAIAGALAVDVSADFHARVRQRIAGMPMRQPFWHRWRIVAPIAAAAGLAAVTMVTTVPVRDRSPSLSLPARPVSFEPMAPALGRTAPQRSVVTRAYTIDRSRAAVSTRVPAEPEVLVPPEEIEMYRRLIAAAQNVPHAVVVEAVRDIVPPQSVSEIAIDPIRIDLIAPPVGGEGERK